MNFSKEQFYFFVTTVLFISNPFFSFAQTTFQKLYSKGGTTLIQSVEQLSDGSFITSACTGDSSGFYFISKYDATGNVLWTKELSVSPNFDPNSKAGELINGGLYFLGCTNADPTSYSSVILVTMDSAGTVLNSHVYSAGQTGMLLTPSLRQDSTGNFYISARALGLNGDFFFLVKADSNTNPIWINSFCSAAGQKEHCHDLEFTPEGGLIAVGGDAFMTGFYIVKTDSSGNLVWAKKYSTNNSDFIIGTSICKTVNEEYIISGKFTSGAFGFALPMLLKIDSSGNYKWAKYYGDIGTYYIPDNSKMKITSDGGYAITSLMYDANFSFVNPLLIKTDSSGNELWTKRYNLNDDHDAFFSIDNTADGGVIISSNAMNPISGFMSGSLIKTDLNGGTNCNNVTVFSSSNPVHLQITQSSMNIPDNNDFALNITTSDISLYYSENCSVVIGEKEIESRDELKIYPNPAIEFVNFEFNNKSYIEIINIFGEVVWYKKTSSNETSVKVNSSVFPSGIYFVRSDNLIQKFVKE